MTINRLYQRYIQPVLFEKSQDNAEIAHNIVAGYLRRASNFRLLCRTAGWWNRISGPELRQEICGLKFPNPIGLAAGFDKNAEFLWPMVACGFGFEEIGSVLPQFQAGNEDVRMLRLPDEFALLNRMGFNSLGMLQVKENLIQAGRLPVPVGINIGKMKTTANEHAGQDYCAVLECLYEYGDYFVINISSPNTPGLRALQSAKLLRPLLLQIKACMDRLAKGRRVKPLVVKLAPDLTDEELDVTIQVIIDCGVDIVILGNTKIILRGKDTWGKSGRPILQRAINMIEFVHRHTEGRLPIIGCGGVSAALHACAMLDAGAKLVQIFTGMIYHGPMLAKEIATDIRDIRRRCDLMRAAA